MITYLLILVLLCNFASGDEVDLEICVKSVRDSQNALKRRPSVPVQNCQDRDMACPEIFKFTADAGMKLANNLNPDQDYKVPENCQKDQYKMLARQICPQTCATCCLTKEYNCQNIGGEDGPCRNFSRAMCSQFPNIALQLCPQICGLCHLPGAANMCPDTIDGCDVLVGLGICFDNRFKNLCQRSCFSRECLTNQTISRGSCRDDHTDCPRHRNLCNVGDYGVVMRVKCRLTCGLCR